MRTLFQVMRLWLSAASASLSSQAAPAQSDTFELPTDLIIGHIMRNETEICTGFLVEPNLALTAAHCLFSKKSNKILPPEELTFRSAQNDRAPANERRIIRTVLPTRYEYVARDFINQLRNDVALLKLQPDSRIVNWTPLPIASEGLKGEPIGLIAISDSKAQTAEIQEFCDLKSHAGGLLILLCDVRSGFSGAPLVSFRHQQTFIIALVTGKAVLNGENVAIGAALHETLNVLKTKLAGHVEP